MSQYPWPEDIYAVARQDWCRSLATPEGGPVAQLVCNNLARQCGSFTNATRDRARIGRTAPQLQELLKAAEILEWEGKCPRAQVEGVCNLGGAKSFQQDLWGSFAQPREDAFYRHINALPSPEEAAEEAAASAAAAGPASSSKSSILKPPSVAAAERMSAPPQGDTRLLNSYAIAALPFL